jgi:retron-type reverse transcriptase
MIRSQARVFLRKLRTQLKGTLAAHHSRLLLWLRLNQEGFLNNHCGSSNRIAISQIIKGILAQHTSNRCLNDYQQCVSKYHATLNDFVPSLAAHADLDCSPRSLCNSAEQGVRKDRLSGRSNSRSYDPKCDMNLPESSTPPST